MSLDFALIALFRFVAGLIIVAGVAWLGWKFVKNFRARAGSRRMTKDRRRQRLRVPRERRTGPRRGKELERAQAAQAVREAVRDSVVGRPSGDA